MTRLDRIEKLIEENSSQIADLLLTVKHTSHSVSALSKDMKDIMDATTRLIRIMESHENRISRLEDRPEES